MSTPTKYVLCHAFGGEPVRLHALNIGADGIEVAGSDPDLSIGWPAAFAFDFDAELFASLRAAHMRGDRAELERLWKRARPVDLRGAEE